MKKLSLMVFFIVCLAIYSSTAFAENETGIIISDLDVVVGLQSEAGLDNDTKISKEANPSDTVKFSVEIENLFDHDLNCDEDNEDDKNECEVEDITVEIIISEIDDGDDITAKTEKFMMSEDSKKTNEISLAIPAIVESNVYDVIIKVEGDNVGNSSKYYIEWALQLEVSKKDHDIQILKYDLNPSVLECGVLQTNMDIELFNYGKSDESDVALEIKSADLNINERFTGINLGKDYDSDSRYQTAIPLAIADEFLTENGNYPITVNVYFDDDKLDDQKIVSLEIKGCSNQTETEETAVEEQPEENITTIAEPVNETTEIEQPNNDFVNQIPNVVYKNVNDFGVSYYIPVLLLIIVIGSVFLIRHIVFIKK